jgi:hypothetical protein
MLSCGGVLRIPAQQVVPPQALSVADEVPASCLRAVLVCREGKFHVLQEEPDVAAMKLMGGTTNLASMDGYGSYSPSPDSPFGLWPAAGELQDSSSMEALPSPAELWLDSVRAQLETLLPESPSPEEGWEEDGDGSVPGSS